MKGEKCTEILQVSYHHCFASSSKQQDGYPKSNTPFTKASPNYPHYSNADNSMKITFTNSEVPKIIHTFSGAAIKKKILQPNNTGDHGPHLGNNLHYFGIAFTNSYVELRSQIPKSALDADTMRMIAASKKCRIFCYRSYFTTK